MSRPGEGRSLFGRIARYGRSPVRNPREDRLTEIFAAVFDNPHCEGLARRVALNWLKQADDARSSSPHSTLEQAGEWGTQVRTQVPLTDGDRRRRLDLGLMFSAPGRGSVAIRVEVKHGTGPHSGQVKAYADAPSSNDTAVVLLAPRADLPRFPEGEVPPGVASVSWEDTARAIESFMPLPDAIGTYLVEELLNYMTEEHLRDPERLTADHFTALEQQASARQALECLGAEAAKRLPGDRGQAAKPGHTGRPPSEYWWDQAPQAAAGLLGEDWYWDWKILIDAADLVPYAEHRPAVFVGFTNPRGSLPVESVSQRLQDFEPFEAKQSYVLRWRYLEQLVGDGTLDEQACCLARWLKEAGQALSAEPMPEPA